MSARSIDINGFLNVAGCPITREGIFEYSAAQLGLPGDPSRIVNVYRPASEIQKPEFIESIKNIPLIDDHTLLDGTGDATGGAAPEEVGIDGIVTGNVGLQNGWIKGDLRIYSQRMKDLLAKGKKELSLGYACEFEPKRGTFGGKPYEFIQRMGPANHLALVDAARVGGAHVADSRIIAMAVDSQTGNANRAVFNIKEVIHMAKDRKAFDNAVEQLKALLPALSEYLNEEAQEPAHQDAGPEAQAPGAVATAPEAQAAAPAEATPAPAAAAPAEAPVQDNHAELIPVLESILTKLKASQAPAEAAAAPEAAPAAAPAAEAAPAPEAAEKPKEGAEQMAEENKPEVPENKPEGNEAEDALQGLAEGSPKDGEPAVDSDTNKGEGFSGNNGSASQGPAEGKHTQAGDAALRAVYKDQQLKTGIYNRLSRVIGAFDHSTMTAMDMAEYGAKEVGIAGVKGVAAVHALDGFLKGVEKAQGRSAVKANAADSKTQVADSGLETLLNKAY